MSGDRPPPTSGTPPVRFGPRAAQRIAVSLVAGLVVAALVVAVGPWWLTPLAGWDAMALVFLGWMWRGLWPLDAQGTAEQAKREDPSRADTDVLLLGASLVSLLAVGLVLVRAGSMKGLDKGLLVGMCVVSIVLAWSLVHTVFTLRYARLYYGSDTRAVDFNQDDAPVYTDFAYLALTIGMTFQVSDTDLQTKEIRRTALRHALLSYVFGALIVGATVNLIAGLGK